MSRIVVTTLAGLAVASWLSLCPVYAQGRGPHGAAPQAHPTVQTPPAKPTPPAHPAKPEGKTAESPKPTPPEKATKFVERIERNPELTSRLKALLPSGMTLEQAAQGFKNEGQFIAALHVSHNLDIPFDKLKAEMTGTDHDSLGQAIHDLKPAANANAEARKADNEAKEDLKTTAKKTARAEDHDDKK